MVAGARDRRGNIDNILDGDGSYRLEFHVRVLINEAGAVVDLVVNDHVQVLLGAVLGHLLEGEFLGVGHNGAVESGAKQEPKISWKSP